MSASEENKPVVGSAFEIGWEHATQEEIIIRVDRHLILVLLVELDGIDRSRIALEARHYKLFGEAVRSDFLREWRVGGAQAARLHFLSELLTCLVDLLLNNLISVLDARAFGVLWGSEFSEFSSSLRKSNLVRL